MSSHQLSSSLLLKLVFLIISFHSLYVFSIQPLHEYLTFFVILPLLFSSYCALIMSFQQAWLPLANLHPHFSNNTLLIATSFSMPNPPFLLSDQHAFHLTIFGLILTRSFYLVFPRSHPTPF